MIRPDELAPAQRSRISTARVRFISSAERVRKLIQDDGATDAEAAVALISALTATIGDVLICLVPAAERAAHVRDLSAALHIELMKEGS